MDIKYKISMHSWWHCSSGLSAGGDADSLVIKDRDGLPYIPGRTMKGLVREAAEEMLNSRMVQEDLMDRMFGKSGSAGADVFFSDAVIATDREAILKNKLSEYLFHNISRTKIEDGTAADSSLRKVEVTVPCELEGTILSVPEEGSGLIIDSLALIKRLGFGRNRGLGRCTITVER